MDEKPLDMLQIKIERARDELPEETRKAIDAVDWRGVILSLREKKGFSYEQLEDLELETELLLCGLSAPENYPKELQEKLKITKPQVDLLVNEMNELVFKKIREVLIQNTEKKELLLKKTESPINTPINEAVVKVAPEINQEETTVLNKAGINIVETLKNDSELAKVKPTESFASKKLSDTFKITATKSEYSLDNKSKPVGTPVEQENNNSSKLNVSKTDPYRMSPDE